jgi:hemolysin III
MEETVTPAPFRRRLVQRVNESYTLGEEIIHSLTHGVGAALSGVGLVVLLVLAITRGTTIHVISFAIYGASMVALFVASTLFHGIQRPQLRPILRKVDHACIYLFIAGTYTPFILLSIRTSLGMTLLAAVWVMAVCGIVYKVFFIDRYVVATTLAYVGMGLMSMIAWREMVVYLPRLGLIFILIGGGLYLLGVVFYALTKIRYTHAVWHVLIMGASICHFIAVLTLLNGV